MPQGTKVDATSPALTKNQGAVFTSQADVECLPSSISVNTRSPLDTLVREGARRMLRAALEGEVQTFLEEHAASVDDQGRRLVVRNGHPPTRETLTGAGALEVSQPQVRGKSPNADDRADYEAILRVVKETQQRAPMRVLAYCLLRRAVRNQ